MQRSGGAVAAIAVVLLLLLPIFYVLAVGPIVWFADRGYITVESDGIVETIYRPLERLCDKSEFVGRVIYGYIQLWQAPTPPPYTPSAMPAPAPVPQPAPATSGS